MTESLSPPGFSQGRTYTGEGKGGPDPLEAGSPDPPLLKTPIYWISSFDIS